MTREEMMTEYDNIMSSDTIDLDKADNLKSALSGVFEDLSNAQKDNEFYIKQLDDLKRQNRALYLRQNPTTQVEQPPQEPEQPKQTPLEIYCSAFDKSEDKLF